MSMSKWDCLLGQVVKEEEIASCADGRGTSAPTASSVDRLKDSSVSCVPYPGSWRWGFGVLVTAVLSLSKGLELSPTPGTLK